MTDGLIEMGGCYGMEMNVGKTKVMRICRQPSPILMWYRKNNLRLWSNSTVWRT